MSVFNDIAILFESRLGSRSNSNIDKGYSVVSPGRIRTYNPSVSSRTGCGSLALQIRDLRESIPESPQNSTVIGLLWPRQ
jgi:hypothetical protein